MSERGRLEHAEHLYEAAHLSELLANDPRTAAPELRVTLAGQAVTVTGTVTTEARRRAVTEVLQDAAPDLEVRNDTTVVDLSGRPSNEVIR